MMFAMVLPPPRTSISLGAGDVCFLAHAGSASMASGLRAGAFPSNVTVPVMVDAANVTRGHNAAATSATARHNLFPVTRMLGSFVNLTRWSSPDGPPVTQTGPAAEKFDFERTLHRTRHAGNPPRRIAAPAFSISTPREDRKSTR